MRTLDRGLEQLLTIDLRSLYALAHKIFEGKDIQQDYQKACRLFCVAALRVVSTRLNEFACTWTRT